jgi:hypothetical protein
MVSSVITPSPQQRVDEMSKVSSSLRAAANVDDLILVLERYNI